MESRRRFLLGTELFTICSQGGILSEAQLENRIEYLKAKLNTKITKDELINFCGMNEGKMREQIYSKLASKYATGLGLVENKGVPRDVVDYVLAPFLAIPFEIYKKDFTNYRVALNSINEDSPSDWTAIYNSDEFRERIEEEIEQLLEEDEENIFTLDWLYEQVCEAAESMKDVDEYAPSNFGEIIWTQDKALLRQELDELADELEKEFHIQIDRSEKPKMDDLDITLLHLQNETKFDNILSKFIDYREPLSPEEVLQETIQSDLYDSESLNKVVKDYLRWFQSEFTPRVIEYYEQNEQ